MALSTKCSIFIAIFITCIINQGDATPSNAPFIVLLWEESEMEEYPAWVQWPPFFPVDNPFNISVVEQDLTYSSIFETTNRVCKLVSDGAVAVVAVLHCPALATVRSVLGDMQVPLISVNPHDGCEVARDTYSHVYPPSTPDSTTVLQQVILEAEWRDVALIYDLNEVHLVEPINSALLVSNVSVQMFKVDPEKMANDVGDLLQYVHDHSDTPTNFILLCDEECVQEFFLQAIAYDQTHDQQGLYDYKARWLLILERAALDWLPSHVGDLDNVAVLVGVEEQTNSSSVFAREILSQTYYILEYLLTKLAPSGTTDVDLTYDVTACGQRLRLATHLANELDLQIPTSNCHNCTMYEVYSALWKPGRTRELQAVAAWSEMGLFAHAPIFPNTNFGLNGRKLIVGTNFWGPFMLESPDSPHGYEGLCMDIIGELTSTLNFSFSLQVPADGEWGVLKDDGSFSGLVGQLEKKEVDLVVAPLAVQPMRETVMDFTEYYYLSYTTVLVKMPDPEANKWKMYLSPFQWRVWILVAMAMPFAGVVMWGLTRGSPFYPKEMSTQGLHLLGNANLFTFGAFFAQGTVNEPRAQSGRFFFWFWFLYCIVVMATYSGNLIAFLTVSKSALAFQSLEGMLSSGIKFGTLGGSVYIIEFQNTRDRTMKEMYQRMLDFNKSNPDTFAISNAQHVARVLDGDYAYVSDKTGFEIAMSQHCEIDIIKEEFLPVEYAVGLRNNSYLGVPFSAEIKKIKESGLINKWKATWWPRQQFCSRGVVTESKPVSVSDMQGAYFLLCIFLLLAILALVCESLIKLGSNKFWQRPVAVPPEASSRRRSSTHPTTSNHNTDHNGATPGSDHVTYEDYVPGSDDLGMEPTNYQTKYTSETNFSTTTDFTASTDIGDSGDRSMTPPGDRYKSAFNYD